MNQITKQFTSCIRQRVSKLMVRNLPLTPKRYSVEKYIKKFWEFSKYLNHRENALGNTVYFLHFKCDDNDTESQRPTILFSRGNGIDLTKPFRLEKLCSQLNCNGVIYDYSGFGLSHIAMDSENNYNYNDVEKRLKQYNYEDIMVYDIECIFNYLSNECNICNKNIVLFGNHIGTYPTIRLASKLEAECDDNIRGIVLESSIISVLRTCAPYLYDKFDSQWIEKYDTLKNFREIENINNTPILFIQDKNDKMVQFDDVLKLYSLVQSVNQQVSNPLWLINCVYDRLDLERIPIDDDDFATHKVVSRDEYFDYIKTELHF